MTVTRRLVIGFGVLVVLLMVLGGAVLGQGLWLRSWSAGYSDTTKRVNAAATIAEASASMVIYGTAEVTAVEMTSRDKFQATREEDRAEVVAALDVLDGLANGDAQESAELQNMRNAFDQCDQALVAAVELAHKGSVASSEQALVDIRGKALPLAAVLDEAATTYLEKQEERETSGIDGLQNATDALLVVLLIVVAVAVMVGLAASVYLTKMIGRQLRSAVSSISSSAAELLAIASQVAAGAAQTAASTNETTATVEEVKQTAQLAYEKATQVAESSQNVARVAEDGRATVEETVTAFERIQGQMNVVAEAITRLTEQTQAVGDIIATVNDLAEQSNLLSVNASIEAAKAGDHGKGFTVVAQEVKSLAEQSKQAVAQVRTILNEIQKASGMAVQAAEQGREAIEAGRHQIEDTGTGTLALAESATDAAQSASQISASSRQQLAGMEQISQAIESINAASTQSVAGTRQVEHEVKQLQALGSRLKRLVDARATV